MKDQAEGEDTVYLFCLAGTEAVAEKTLDYYEGMPKCEKVTERVALDLYFEEVGNQQAETYVPKTYDEPPFEDSAD